MASFVRDANHLALIQIDGKLMQKLSEDRHFAGYINDQRVEGRIVAVSRTAESDILIQTTAGSFIVSVRPA